MSDFIKLQTKSILDIPFSRYRKDFTFIVNGEEFQTSQFIADLLSPNISKARYNDPTISEFSINTQSEGNFQEILDLINFNSYIISTNNRSFVFEIFEQLGTTNIDIQITHEDITIDNVIGYLNEYEQKPIFKEHYNKLIEFFSSHFSEILEEKKDEIYTISKYSNENILMNEHLTITSEDELFQYVNKLYQKDKNNSNLYEYVYFTNVSTSEICKFISEFDINDLTNGTWKSISNRLEQEVKIKTEKTNKRYKQNFKELQYSNNNEFDGIINYLKNNSNIKDEINITYSSENDNGKNGYEIIDYGNKSNWFVTCNEQNSWICIEFKKHKIIPTNYTIRSNNSSCNHLISWIVEGSNDNKNWEILNEQKNNSILKGPSLVHTFPIETQNQKEITFIRLRQTGINSSNCHYLYISAFEIYGKII